MTRSSPQSDTLVIPAGHLATSVRLPAYTPPPEEDFWRVMVPVAATDPLRPWQGVPGTGLILSDEPKSVAVALSVGTASANSLSSLAAEPTRLCVNDDDDAPGEEDDLAPVSLYVDLDSLEEVVCHSSIVITWNGTGTIRLWGSADPLGSPIPIGTILYSYHGGEIPPPPDTLYVEGISPGHGTLSLLAYIDDVLVGYDQVEIDVEECKPKINLQAYTITSDPQTGYNHWEPGRFLQKEKEDNPGAFLPLNDDDDDYDEEHQMDWQQTGAIAGEDDLLPVHISATSEYALEGQFRLVIPGFVRIWKYEDRADAIQNGELFWLNDLDFGNVFVEGIGPGVGSMTLEWVSTDGSRKCDDTLKLTVFQMRGPLNVPGRTTYTYSADVLPSVQGAWVDGVGAGGTVVARDASAFGQQDELIVTWANKPLVGHPTYEIPDYQWSLAVNVVRVVLVLPLLELE